MKYKLETWRNVWKFTESWVDENNASLAAVEAGLMQGTLVKYQG